MVASTLWPGNWPPLAGLCAPGAILDLHHGRKLTEIFRRDAKSGPDATCLIAERMEIAIRHRA